MTDHHHEMHVPKAALIGAAVLIAFTIAVAALSRQGVIARDIAPAATALETRALYFRDRVEGGVAAVAADSGAVITVFEPGTNGFVRGVLRGLAQERKRRGLGAEPPFLLTRYDDGRLALTDPATGREVELVSFGPTNAEVFANLLPRDKENS